ncbi:hypothetical protein YWS52_09580 [Chitiniphilus shinanonensis]
MKSGTEDQVLEALVDALEKEEKNVNIYEALAGYLSMQCRANYFPVFLLKRAAKQARHAGNERQAMLFEREIEVFRLRNPSLSDSGVCVGPQPRS